MRTVYIYNYYFHPVRVTRTLPNALTINVDISYIERAIRLYTFKNHVILSYLYIGNNFFTRRPDAMGPRVFKRFD